MKTARALPILLTFILVSSATSAPPSQTNIHVRETDNFDMVFRTVAKMGKTHGIANVLLVIDIDSTLLAMNQDLGSDHWFNWQSSLLENSPNSPFLVATNFPGLLKVQGVLYALAGMHSTEPDLAGRLAKLQRAGCQSIALTARGYEFRDATRRELKRNGFSFHPNPHFPPSVLADPFKPYRQSAITAYGLPAATANKLRSRPPRDVTFSEGVFMSAGQDKGVMLRRLLDESKYPVKAIVFVDDGDKNITAMADAFKATSIELHAFDYTRLDNEANDFLNSPSRQNAAKKAWEALRTVIAEVMAAPSALP